MEKIPRSQPSLPEIYIQLSQKLDQANLTTSFWKSWRSARKSYHLIISSKSSSKDLSWWGVLKGTRFLGVVIGMTNLSSGSTFRNKNSSHKRRQLQRQRLKMDCVDKLTWQNWRQWESCRLCSRAFTKRLQTSGDKQPILWELERMVFVDRMLSFDACRNSETDSKMVKPFGSTIFAN